MHPTWVVMAAQTDMIVTFFEPSGSAFASTGAGGEEVGWEGLELSGSGQGEGMLLLRMQISLSIGTIQIYFPVMFAILVD